MLDEARAESNRDWWKQQFPLASEAAWKADEHESTCALLSLIVRLVANETSKWESSNFGVSDADVQMLTEFASLMDNALSSLERFIEAEVNHRPKSYFWLPGIALTILGESAGLPLDWLHARHQDNHKGYARLPLKLVTSAQTLVVS